MCGFIACFQCSSAKGYSDAHGRVEVQADTSSYNDDTSLRCQLDAKIRNGLDRIQYRGPDGLGTWISDDGRTGLGHCRLAINDLSDHGLQPLHSNNGKVHAVVNGEIYDYEELRTLCEKNHSYTFSSSSDSELIVALYTIFGTEKMFTYLRGEFSFAIFDETTSTGKLILAKDRYGIKPLFWTVLDGSVIFVSESKVLLSFGWKPEWDVESICENGSIVDTRTIFKGVRSVPPGHWVEVTEADGVRMERYWDLDYNDKRQVESRSTKEMVLGVRERLVEAVRQRLRADVKVGVYLSGGLDSSAIAGIVSEFTRKHSVKIGNDEMDQLTCFCVRLPKGYDESEVAERSADWLGVKIHFVDADEEALASNFYEAVYHSEQPNFDFNGVAKYLLSQLVQSLGIKVILSGEGSDEHFLGYPSYIEQYLNETDLALPKDELSRNTELRESMLSIAGAEAKNIQLAQGSRDIADHFAKLDAAEARIVQAVSLSVLPWSPSTSLYAPWVAQKELTDDFKSLQALLNAQPQEIKDKIRDTWHPAHSAMYMWNKTIFKGFLLTALGDRSEMAHSIEGRTPFLDHHLTQYVNRLPPSVKLRYTPKLDEGNEAAHSWLQAAGPVLNSLTSKWILREASKPFVTQEIYKRRKVPFVAPSRWPKDGPMQTMFQKLLTREAVEQLGFVNWQTVQDCLETAFGENANGSSFRSLTNVANWVALSQQFGIAKAQPGDTSVVEGVA